MALPGPTSSSQPEPGNYYLMKLRGADWHIGFVDYGGNIEVLAEDDRDYDGYRGSDIEALGSKIQPPTGN
jgi:hypothetical protein